MVYCAATMTYGGVRKVVRMRDAHIELRNTVTHVVKRVPTQAKAFMTAPLSKNLLMSWSRALMRDSKTALIW